MSRIDKQTIQGLQLQIAKLQSVLATTDTGKAYLNLEAEHQRLLKAYNEQAKWLQAMQNSGKLIINTTPAEKLNGFVRVETADRLLDDMVGKADRLFYFGAALADLQTEIAEIDAIATYASLTDLPGALAGRDETLSALFTRVIGAARGTQFEAAASREFSTFISARIAGIQTIRQDRGAALRQVVKETSAVFGQRMRATIDKARQGQHMAPKTERILEYAKRFKYDAKAEWKAAADACLDDLKQRELQLDTPDQELLIDLASRSGDARGAYFRNAFHSGQKRQRA